ncbi:hypothetical protein ABTX81_30420 [Kitasatospora sp. NPDC097605]|uniref:hypothetical protein n=1 Tax=Kitasatospora sp. NPDC097605 TaxID=3157226 RepID=UPI003319B88A
MILLLTAPVILAATDRDGLLWAFAMLQERCDLPFHYVGRAAVGADRDRVLEALRVIDTAELPWLADSDEGEEAWYEALLIEVAALA